jgi:Tfp pilus assembly protein PilF
MLVVELAELMGRRNQQRAKELLERAVELDSTVPQAHQFLAEIYRVEKDVPKMIYHLRECLRVDPHNDYVRRFLVRLGVDLEHPEGDRRR